MVNLPADPAHRADEEEEGNAARDWSALMAAGQDGHGGAYRRLLAEISPWLKRYFRRRLPPADVDDAVQETLLAVHRRRHTFDPRYPLEPWLAAIAKRKWVDQLRRIERRPTEELTDDLPDRDREAEATNASVLASLLAELRPAQSRAILLVKVEGYSIDEASRDMGLSPSAVKMSIHRGLGRLAALIENTDGLD